MKRLLLPGLLLLAMARSTLGADSTYINNGNVLVPTMNPDLIQLDTTNFVNNGTFSVDMTLIQNPIGGNVIYTTSDTQNYTNNGTLTLVPGFDIQNFPADIGQAHMAASFANNGNGFGGGVITVTNIFGGANPFISQGLFGPIIPINFELQGLSIFRVRATNVVDSGLVSMDNTGLIDVSGENVNLNHSRFLMTGALPLDLAVVADSFSSVDPLDSGLGTFGTNTFGLWEPGFDLTPTTALTPTFLTTSGLLDQMQLTNAVAYFQSTTPQVNAAGVLVWRGIFLQDNSPTNVSHNIYFSPGDDIIGGGAFHIEWVGNYRSPLTGQIATNYFYLSDVPAIRRSTNSFFLFRGIPTDFSFSESTTQQIFAVPTPPGYANPAPIGLFVTNDFSYVSGHPVSVLVDTNVVVGGSVTNLPGRIQLKSSGAMNLANTRIFGSTYFSLNASSNFLGNSNSIIAAPYADLNIGVTNGSLTLSNLLIPELPAWSQVPDAPTAVSTSFGPAEMGGIQAWSGSYIFVDANGFTNDVRILLVNSAIKPTSPAFQQNVFLHATNSQTLNDELNIFNQFASDTKVLTIASNDNSAFSLSGQLNLLSPDIYWSSGFTNLQFLTNAGLITTENLAIFAGNVFNPHSDLSLATPYQAFVNHGTIIDQGTFIRANYFENSGAILEKMNNGLDIGVTGNAIITNSVLAAPFGPITLAADSLLVSNSVVVAGQKLIFNVPCSISDGYVFGNMFGHITNATLPNVVTNGNFWSAGAGVQFPVKPPTADLLGTILTNIALGGNDSINLWPGEDRGCSPAGYATNLALGRMIFISDANPSQFTFMSLTGSNALYVDSIEFQGNTTNTDNAGNFSSIVIAPGMKIYYAQALMNGVSVAEKLNGKNGGGFCWVSNYAGVYSSTNIQYPDGNTYIFNEALAISPTIASGGPDGSSGIPNVNNPFPIPTNEIFDIVNIGPQPCDSIVNPPPPDPTNSPVPLPPSFLPFPPKETQTQQGGQPTPVSFTDALGAYNGLFYETNGVNPTRSGSFTAKVTAKGGFSAKLQTGSHTYSLSKSFDISGSFSNSVASKGLASLTVVLQLVNNDQIVGEVSGADWSAQLIADRAAFSSKNQPPAEWVGKDTLLLSSGVENSNTPAGDSFASVTVTKAGDVQWSGVLPDGSKVSQKSALSKDGLWPLYSAPYGGTGSFIGWMQFTNDNTDIQGSAVWVAPAGKSAVYPAGLTNHLDATGSSLTGTLGGLAQNITILTGGPLASPVTNSVTISGKTGQNSDGTLKLSVNVKTGLFTGTMTDGGGKLSIQGALLEKSGMGGGFFLNADKDQGGKVSLAPAN